MDGRIHADECVSFDPHLLVCFPGFLVDRMVRLAPEEPGERPPTALGQMRFVCLRGKGGGFSRR